MKNPTTKWVTIAGMFRAWEMFSIVYFVPVFFMRNFPQFSTVYSLYNGLIIAVAGIISALMGGIIGDMFEARSKMTKALVCIGSSVISIPLIALCTLNTTSFYTSLFFFGLRRLIGEAWLSPGITMMQATVKPEEQGSVVGAHYVYQTAIGCLSTIILGNVANRLGAMTNPAIYG